MEMTWAYAPYIAMKLAMKFAMAISAAGNHSRVKHHLSISDSQQSYRQGQFWHPYRLDVTRRENPRRISRGIAAMRIYALDVSPLSYGSVLGL